MGGLGLSWLGWLTWNPSLTGTFVVVSCLLCISPVATRLADLRVSRATGGADPQSLATRFLLAQVTAVLSSVALGFLGLVGALVCVVTVPIAIGALTLAFTGATSRRAVLAVIVGELAVLAGATSLSNVDERPLLALALALVSGGAGASLLLVRCRAKTGSPDGDVGHAAA